MLWVWLKIAIIDISNPDYPQSSVNWKRVVSSAAGMVGIPAIVEFACIWFS